MAVAELKKTSTQAARSKNFSKYHLDKIMLYFNSLNTMSLIHHLSNFVWVLLVLVLLIVNSTINSLGGTMHVTPHSTKFLSTFLHLSFIAHAKLIKLLTHTL